MFMLALISFKPEIMKSQNALEVFGKNKIQYTDDQFDWWIYETNNFVVYWYGKSRPAAQFCIEIAETENSQVQKLFEYHLKDKIELVIYADGSDLSQTNIHLDGLVNQKYWNQEPKIKDQKILLYFDGDHEHLRNLLRAGITQLYFNSMFSGTALQDVVQKVISFRLPDWFEKGLIQYLSKGWKLEDQIEFYKIWDRKTFKKTSNKYPELTGQSFWNYLISTFGEQAISNWLYMTRIQKDIESSARLVFSLSFEQLQSDWFNFYNVQYTSFEHFNDVKKNSLSLKLKPEEQVTSINHSHLNNKLILTTNQNSKTRVRIFDEKNSQNKTIFKKGSRTKLNNPDYNYPIYFEDSSNDIAYIIYQKKNRVCINSYDHNYLLLNRYTLPEEIQSVYSGASYSKEVLILSGNTNGYSDLMTYNLKTRQFKKITDDIWDDLDVQVNMDPYDKKIRYRSNRPNTESKLNKLDSILPLGRFALFSFYLNDKYNLLKNKLEFELPGKTIKNWSSYKNNIIINLEEEDRNRWLVYQNDSTFEILNKFQADIISNQLFNDELYFILIDNHRSRLVKVNIENEIQKFNINRISPAAESAFNKDADTITYRIDSLYFQSKFGNPSNLIELLSEFEKKSKKTSQTKFSSFSKYLKYEYPDNAEFNSNLAIAYRNRFGIEELSSTINNELLFSGLNTFSGTSQNYEPPPFGILFKSKVTELFENSSIEGGIRIPTSFDGLEGYLMYENRKKRFDHTFAAYYKTNTNVTGSTFSSNIKKQTNVFLVNHQVKYPFDHYKSLKAITTIRNDHIFYLSTNKPTLYDSIDYYQQRIGTRLEYVFDNALDISLNIKNGWQVKFFFEISKRFELNPKSKSRFYPGALMIAGFDARLHIPVLTKSVFANRCYVNTSFGKERILYHVGGTENWIIPKYEDQSALETSGEYTYSALATEVRSYGYGARKAGSVFGISSEIRIPFLQYIINQNWRNSILRNFQILAFVDAAYVWDGFLPDFDTESNLDYHAENPVVKIDLQYSRTPLIAGTGFGLRTSLFGYFIRFDYAWKLESSGLNDPKYSFSLGLDF